MSNRWAAVLAGLLVGACSTSTNTRPDGAGGGDASTIPISCPSPGAIDGGGPNKDNGLACTCPSECKSNFCVDGYCCESACDGTCMSCGLPTSLGMCTMVPAGVLPTRTSECATQDPKTCLLDGTCDGTGACRNYPAGTTCGAGACTASEIVGTLVCDGAGNCKAGATFVCAPFSCNPGTSSCLSSCASDADCVSGRPCVNGSCGLEMIGGACPRGPSDCDSGFCVDGVCCDSACDGVCVSCNQVGLAGTCSPIPAGQGHPLCKQQDPSSCGTTGVCDGSKNCSLYPANTPCGAAVCVDATSGSAARTCDGLGMCQAATTFQCTNFRCANGACNESCTLATSSTDCADGHVCTVAAGQTVGTCGKKADGQKCSIDTDCLNGHCADGVCCATTCTGACQSCSVTGLLGRCTAVATGAADPHGVCKDTTAAKCATNGKCDGAGACQKYPVGTTCAAETCSNASYTGASMCNAAGQCAAPAATTCSPFQCNGTKCYNTCTVDSQCVAPNSCGMNGNISSCGKKPNGQTCTASAQCTSQQCVSGVCCNTACTDACGSCTISGKVGTCSGKPSGTSCRASAGVCDVAETCNGSALTCPADGFAASSKVCRVSAGACDVAENCTGSSAACPADKFTSSSTTCRASAGVCDVAENCTGSSAACPADKFTSSSTVCRASAGACDVAENCTGSSAACPADKFSSSSTVCRAAVGVCDVAENCTGSLATCPVDAKKANGTTCDDGSACTMNDACTGGVCSGTAVTCPVPDQCHTEGSCAPATGCPAPVAKPNGTTCNDGNPCTTGETCQAGACSGGSPVTCPVPDQCHTQGVCVAATGCPMPVAKTGSCDDGNACTMNDTCSGGVCKGSTVTCPVPDQCHTQGACVAPTGCPMPVAKTGSCDDGNACTIGETCQAGMCTGGSAVTCPVPDECHTEGACVPATGCPTPVAITDGTACSTGVCCSGVCTAGSCAAPAQ